MRTVLIGAVESSAAALRALQRTGHPPLLVATLDIEAGRARHSDYVDLAPLAGPESELLRIGNVNDAAFVARLREIAPDFILVIGWSQIVGPEIRAAARHFAIGFHPTALPRYRGRAPLAWTILLDLAEAGSTLFIIDDGVDSGAILAQETFALDPRETVASLLGKQMKALEEMMGSLAPRLVAGDWEERVQDHAEASYCARRGPADGLIDWTADMPAIDRLIRATSRPYPGAFTFTRTRRLAIWTAEPFEPGHPHFGQIGQVVAYADGCPIVLCGDGNYLRLTDYEAEDGGRLSGQPRLFPSPPARAAA